MVVVFLMSEVLVTFLQIESPREKNERVAVLWNVIVCYTAEREDYNVFLTCPIIGT